MLSVVSSRACVRRIHSSAALLLLALLSTLIVSAAPQSALAAPLYSAVPVSDVGTSNTLAQPNYARMVAVSPDGTIFVAYHGADGVRVARSTNRGQSFQPSVQIANTGGPVSVTVDTSGDVYVAYSTSGQILFSRSTDGGQTFSTPAVVADLFTSGVDIAVDAPYVYILPQDGATIYVNDASGEGVFTARPTGLPGLVFSGILFDPVTHDLFVIGDNPSLYYVKSTDRGATFGSVVNPPGSIFFSTYIGGFGFIGQKVFISGSGTGAVLVDLETGDSTTLTFGSNASAQSRTLAVDGEGNVIDGYTDGTNVMFAVSTDQGQTFGPAEIIATNSIRMELQLNPATNDVVAAYEQGGQIFVNVYSGLLPAPPIPPTASDIADQVTIVDVAEGPLDFTVGDEDGDPAAITLSGLSSNQALVPNANISFGGSGTARTVTVTPAAGASGSATITVIATDSTGRSASDTFVLTVNAGQVDQTISFTAPADTIYGAGPLDLSATASSGLPVSFSSTTPAVCTVSGSAATILAAGTCAITANQAGDAAYNPAPQVQDSFEVAKAPLAITAEDKARAAGEANPPLTFTATGFVNGDTAAVLSGALSTTATADSPTGSYPITQGSLSAANYAITFTPGTLTVTEADTGTTLYLPVVAGPTGPSVTSLGRISPAVDYGDVEPGAVFFQQSVQLGVTDLPDGGRFILSSSRTQVVPIVVNDQLAFVSDGEDLYTHTFTINAGAALVPAALELPRSLVAELAAGGATTELRDVFGTGAGASNIWLLWLDS